MYNSTESAFYYLQTIHTVGNFKATTDTDISFQLPVFSMDTCFKQDMLKS